MKVSLKFTWISLFLVGAVCENDQSRSLLGLSTLNDGPFHGSRFNSRGTELKVSNAIFVWRIQNRMIANFFVFHHNSRQKLTHVGFSTSRKPRVIVSNESWLIFEKSRFMTHI